MKETLRKGMPYIWAIVLFVALSVAYFAPAVFNDKGLVQGDSKSYLGMGRDLREYHEKTGDYAFWSNAMFGGMPANYTYMPPVKNIFISISDLFYSLPRGTAGVLFLYLIGFYIFLLSLGCKNWLSVIGAIAYAFASYNIIIIDAGHINKGLVMATMAPVIGGIILCYRQKYLWGIIVTLIFTGLNVYWNHQQISYYLLLMILTLAVVYFIYAYREHALKGFFKSSVILMVVACLAIAPSAGTLLSTADYAKESMRGGAVLQNNPEGKKESSGLDIDYAYSWSYGRGETMTLLIPNFYGASSHYNIGKESDTYNTLGASGQADQFVRYAPMYWGDQPFTSGPVYAGAIICFLFLLGLLVLKGPEKWWLLVATIISIVLSWGRNFAIVNDFLFYHLPLYNKFRTPSMALVIAGVTMVTLAILVLKQIIEDKGDRQKYLRPLYIAGGITGGLCLLFALFGGGVMSFSAASDAAYRDYPQLIEAIRADRHHMLSMDAWRSFLFIALSWVALWFYLRKSLSVVRLLAIVGVLIFLDLWMVDKRFLNFDSFVPKKQAVKMVETPQDQQILQDKDPNYRVLNLASNTFNESNTSYFHKSLGGYSPAKLRRYQDIIDYYLSRDINLNVLNMLNTRYIIVQTQQGAQVQKNPEALGNVWFVDELKWVNSPDEEIMALKEFDPAKTAVIDVEWKNKVQGKEISQPQDTNATIQLIDYVNPGCLIYESSSSVPQFAVFSEVYYKTWRAYIDGKEVPLVRVDYILRGLEIPAGDHKIEFKCVDEVYLKGARLSLIGSIIVGLVLLSLLGFAGWKAWKKKN